MPSAYSTERWVRLITDNGDGTYVVQEYDRGGTARSDQIDGVKCSDSSASVSVGETKLYRLSRDSAGDWVFEIGGGGLPDPAGDDWMVLTTNGGAWTKDWVRAS